MSVDVADQATKLRLQDVVVVDADVHAHETPGALAPYCDMTACCCRAACCRASERG